MNLRHTKNGAIFGGHPVYTKRRYFDLLYNPQQMEAVEFGLTLLYTVRSDVDGVMSA